MKFLTDEAEIAGPSEAMPPGTRRSYNAADYVASYDVSTVVSSTGGGVVCERAMYGDGRTWAHDSIGVTSPSSTWYLAEGCTAPGFETWVLVQNPNPRPVDIDMKFLTEKGETPGPRVRIPARSRRSYNAAAYVESYNVSTTVTSSGGPVVCERAMYGKDRTWAHDSIGVTEPARTWYLAEGCTAPGFETWVLLENPGADGARVGLTFLTDKGEKSGRELTVAPHSRVSVNVGDSVAGAWDVSTVVSSDAPIVAERAMYGEDRTWAHDSIGVTAPARTWYLAEGCTAPGFETWLLVENPNDSPVDVEMKFLTDKGEVEGPADTIPARSRRSYNAADYVATYNVSTVVSAQGGGVVCERAMYGTASRRATPSGIIAPIEGQPLYPFTRAESIACGHWPPGSLDYPYFGAPRSGTRLHAGIDIYPSAGEGAPVFAIKDGTVIKAGVFYVRANGEAVYFVLVDHGDYVANYAEIGPPAVQAGDVVKPGNVIGLVSSTLQLHFELYTPGTTNWLYWYGAQPANLLDPTDLMLEAFGL
jgi:hypothetical protein